MAKANYQRTDDAFYETILKLQNVEECVQFFKDICSPNELSSIEQRFEVAKLLSEGEVYLDIAQKTGASSATISRVNRMLNNGESCASKVLQRE